MQNHSNEFDLHENELVGGTHFYMNGFALRLVLTRRHKGTRKWPIACLLTNKHRHERRARVIFYEVSEIGAFMELFTVMIWLI